nr:hypothetical protein [Tanacetum cinerariifolium]
MFSINELDGMLEELGLGDNNKILYTHFRIPGMSLDDGHSQSKSVGNAVVIEEIVEDNVVSSSGRDQDCSELGKEEEHVDTSTHASTFDICPVVEFRDDENVGSLYCDNDVPMANAFSFRNVMKDFDVEIHNQSGKESRLLMLDCSELGKEEEHVDTSTNASTFDILVALSSGKESRLLMLDCFELGKEEEHVDTSTHASTFDICPVVESRDDENVGNLYCDNDVPMANAFSFRNVMKDFDVEIHNQRSSHYQHNTFQRRENPTQIMCTRD